MATVRGPLFDGRAKTAMNRYCYELPDDVAQEGERLVRAGTAVFRRPTGYYRSRIDRGRVSANRVDVHDGGMIYGPWLEGVGERNRTTRFKGYFFWRQAGQLLDAAAKPIAEVTLRPYLRLMQ